MDHKETASIVVEQRLAKVPLFKGEEEYDLKRQDRTTAGLRDLLGNGEMISTRVTAS